MDRIIRIFFIAALIYIMWQISRIMFGDFSFFQFIIFSILVVVMIIISIFISGRVSLRVLNHKIDDLHENDEEGDTNP